MCNRQQLLLLIEEAMIDSHSHPEHWGIRPVLFHIGGLDVPSYSFFVLMGLLAGLALFFFESGRGGRRDDNGLIIIIGAISGGILGAKVLEWVLNYRLLMANFSDPEIWLSGRTVVGGLIGGKLGAVLIKKAFDIREKRGNDIAPAVALGILVGRFGCFFRGCCYGKPTGLRWGVDFGDGIMRHPTQLYEATFMLMMFMYIENSKRKGELAPGHLFRLLMICYFIFRFCIEFIRVEPVVLAGLTSFQLIALAVILYFTVANLKHKEQSYARQS